MPADGTGGTESVRIGRSVQSVNVLVWSDLTGFTGMARGASPLPADGQAVLCRPSRRTCEGVTVTGNAMGRVRALLLNASHEPLAVLGARRALLLVLSGKAECLLPRESGEVFRSPSLVISTPAVVRLHHYVRVPFAPISAVSRAGILRRDHRRCAYCHGHGDTIDHVTPRSRGGHHSWENCVACCIRCNVRKADHLLSELGWNLAYTPGPPKKSVGRFWLDDDADPVWQPWLTNAA